MGRSTIHYTDSKTNTILKALHNKLRPAGTPVQRVEYIIELLLLRIFEVKLKREDEFKQLRELFTHEAGKDNDKKLFYYLQTVGSEKILSELNKNFFPFYADILNHARKVIKGNLNTKIQDQLVLIQDVFANSNFTNNVQSGNLEEIINLVAEIDEERLLNTDLLGDAIESSLSETGGTKDIGLFRTPDHVRQFMVGMLEPKISDSVFDPACGTGGFLFDSYGFVIESFRRDGDWPGEKSHPELQAWFKKYFKKNAAPMPTVEQTQQFYRSGIYGIEYLGMIRKMAAVNLYIRGLNPQNIEQGDSLAKFNKELQFKDTFSTVLANPPFGAERDQKAYPNIWEEFSKEGETTILFVKLMLDALKPGGRCAVVVSEGFLTWDQTSAKTLRRMLLTEANLLAVIGLPQGVFVSKSGQGPKTSILVFEKGAQTENVWFYNVENDGYTKGTNRTPIEGCQLPEALDLFHKYVGQGKTPPETRNSFSLSVDWISVVDPRVKEKIRTEVTADIEQKKEKARSKLLERLDKKKQTANKAKPGSRAAAFGKEQYEAEVYKFDCTWQQKAQNEIAKRIDKAHIYSLNSSTYRSSLTEIQLVDWDKAASHHKPGKNGHSLDKRFSLLKQSKLENAIKQIATFDPQNAIEADIVREYLAGLEPETLNKYPALKTIDEIFKSGAKYPMVKLADYLILNENKIKPNKHPDIKYVVLGVSNNIGIFINKNLVPQDTNQSYFLVEPNQFCYNPYRINVGSIGLNKYDFDNQIISGAYIVFDTDQSKLLPEYLLTLFESERFLEFVNSKAIGGVRMNFSFEDMGNWEIPLPPPDKQIEIIHQIKKQKAVVDGAKQILANWEFHIPESDNNPFLRKFVIDSLYGISSKLKTSGKFPVLRMNNLDEQGNWNISDMKFIDGEIPEKRKLKFGDFIFNRTNSIELVGKSAVIDFDFNGTYAGYLIRLRFNQDLNPFYLKYLFACKRYRSLFSSIAKPAGGQANINADELQNIKIDYYEPSEQEHIVKKLDCEMGRLNLLKEMIQEGKKNVEKILASLWEK